VSILLAFGIDAAWEERQERLLERSLLTQLVADLSRAEEQLTGEIILTAKAAQAALDLRSAAQGEGPASADSVLAGLTRMSYWSDPYPTKASAQSLVVSNNLQIISSDVLRSSVVNFLDQIAQLESRVPRHEEELTTWMIEFDEFVNWNQVAFVGILDEGVEANTEAASSAADETALRMPITDDRFELLTIRVFWVHENLRWLQARMREVTRHLREEVARELRQLDG
jgi:hypothetical protein